MTTDRKSFILHRDSLNVLDELDNNQAGLLFKAIKAYQNNDDIELDSITKIVMSPFKSQFERDEQKYNKIVERNKNNGLKGGRPKTQDNQKEPSGLNGLKKEPKKADSGSKSDSDSDSDKELIVDDKSTTAKKVSKFRFSDDDLRCAQWMLELIEKVSKPNQEPNLESWANVVRLMRESDKLDHYTIAKVFLWANQDSFWCSNILSPKKLREKFQQLDAKMKGAGNAANNQGHFNQNRKLGAAERIKLRNEEKYGVQPGGGFCMAEGSGDLRGTMDPGEWRDSIIDVESST